MIQALNDLLCILAGLAHSYVSRPKVWSQIHPAPWTRAHNPSCD